MKINAIVLVTVLVLAPSCLGAPGVGDFFEKLFGVFKPEGIVVTDAPDNATDIAFNETVTETVVTELDNNTEVINAKLTSIVVESLADSEDVTTTEATTDVDTTISTSPSTTTTVVYKLFHPNTTTTTTAATTTATASSSPVAENATLPLSEATNSTTLPTEATVTTSVSESTKNSFSSSTVVNDVLCKTTYDAATNLKVTSCADSPTAKPISKRTAVDYIVESQDETTQSPTITPASTVSSTASAQAATEGDDEDDDEDDDQEDEEDEDTN